MSALSFEINLSGNFATALESANKGLDHTGEGAKKAAKELELFEGEIDGVKGGLGGLEVNLSALAKGGSLFTFDLAEGLKSVIELGSKVVETFVDIGKEMVQVAGATQDLNLAVKLNVGPEGAEELEKLAESFAQTTRFTAAQMKEAWLPLLDIGVKEPKLIDDLSTAAADIAARTHGGISKVQEVLGTFRGIMLKDQISRQTFTSLGVSQEKFYADLGKQLGVNVATAEKMAKAHKVKSDVLVQTALGQIAGREGGELGAGALGGAATLGGTLARLSTLKETIFEGIADSPGMHAIQGFLDNFIETMKGPIGTDLVNTISGAFTSLFGDLSGPDGLEKMETVIGGIASKAESFIEGFERAWPEIRSDFEAALPVIEKLAEALGGVAKVLGALPKLGGELGDRQAQAGIDMATGTVAHADAGGGWNLSLDDKDRAAALDRAGKGGFFHGLFSSSDTLNREALQQIDADKGGWEKVDLSGDDLMSKAPAYAAGGIVSGPTLALIGEAGPEAIVPLSERRGSLEDIIGAGASSTRPGGREVHVHGDIVVHTHGVEGDAESFGQRAGAVVRIELKRFFDELPV